MPPGPDELLEFADFLDVICRPTLFLVWDDEKINTCLDVYKVKLEMHNSDMKLDHECSDN